MAIEDTREIVKVRNTRLASDEEINNYLAAGWVLLGVFAQSSGDGEGWAGVVFTLGWQRPEAPVHPAGSFKVFMENATAGSET